MSTETNPETNTDTDNPAKVVQSPGEFQQREEAPVTFKAYITAGFSAVAGIFYGYDSGYVSGVMGMTTFIKKFVGQDKTVLPASQKSLITSILSAGTFFGSIAAGDLADWYGRRTTILSGCGVFTIGVILQAAASSIALLAVGRIIAGLGIGLVSATVVLYMSEISPRKWRGAIVSSYQFCITIGLLVASCVDYGTEHRTDTAAYRIPICIQFLWALILATGLVFLPESPRYYVKKENIPAARRALAKIRDQPEDSEFVESELNEVIANNEYEKSFMVATDYWDTWKICFKGKLSDPASNFRRIVLGTTLQGMQQLTGVNFIFYFGTTFFQQIGTIHNTFLTQIILNLVNVVATPISFYIVEKCGRRPSLIWGAVGMFIAEYIVAILGTADGGSSKAVSAMVAFMAIYVCFFASTWGPFAWVVVGELYPLQIRSRGVSLSTASNWFWNCIIAIITPYMADSDKGNLGAKVYFVWGTLCVGCWLYAYFYIPETKGLTLEQVDQMLVETTPRNSSKWKPHETFADKLEEEKGEKASVTQESDVANLA